MSTPLGKKMSLHLSATIKCTYIPGLGKGFMIPLPSMMEYWWAQSCVCVVLITAIAESPRVHWLWRVLWAIPRNEMFHSTSASPWLSHSFYTHSVMFSDPWGGDIYALLRVHLSTLSSFQHLEQLRVCQATTTHCTQKASLAKDESSIDLWE